jgi:hypothetical protein
MMAVIHGTIPTGEPMRTEVKVADVSIAPERLVDVEAPGASAGIAAGARAAGAWDSVSAGAAAKAPAGGIRFSGRAMLLVAVVLAGGLAAWYWANRQDEVVVVGTAPAGTGAGWAGAAAPGVVRIRLMDVLAGIPAASTPERTEWPVTWTSHFTLAGAEAGVLTMRSDPADLNYASIALPLPAPNDDASADRVRVTARRFLRNVSPEYEGGGGWLTRAITTVAEHPEQTQTTKTERATFTVRALRSGKGAGFLVEMRLNR